MSPDAELPPLQLDHVEVFVPDRAAAAAWYSRALGLKPVPGTETWAAFQVTGPAFVVFLKHAEALALRDRSYPLRLTDHGGAISAYFRDPYGHRLEVTTYDPIPVRGVLPSSRFTDAG